jgi:uncharacterized OB-fold protein
MKIMVSSCKRCSRTIAPPRDICPYCGKLAGKMVLHEIDGRGKVISHTVLQMPPEGFKPPLKMALVELEQGAVVLSLAGEDNAELTIGAHVRIDEDSDNRLRYHLLP